MLKFKSTLNGRNGRSLLKVKLYNSETYAVGDLVTAYANGVAQLATAAEPVLGVIHAFVLANGQAISDGDIVAGTAKTAGKRSVTTDASNSDGYYALVDVSKETIYSAEVNGTLGTTNDSDLIGAKIDIDSDNTDYGRVLESTATRTVATTANFVGLGEDPEDSDRLLVKIANSELDADANTEA